jgi:hypothetical protein
MATFARPLFVAVLLIAGLGFGLGSPHLAAAAQGGNGGGAGITTACEQHAENPGNSYAYGLDCASASFSYSDPCTGGEATQTFSGAGLLPGSSVFITWVTGPAAPQTFYLASGNLTGSFSVSAVGLILFPGSFYVSGTDANGQPVTSPTFAQTACP